MTEFVAEFNRYKEQNPGDGITINTLLLKVCAEAVEVACRGALKAELDKETEQTVTRKREKREKEQPLSYP